MLHFSHVVGQFGENIALQVQFCKVFPDTSKSRGHLSVLEDILSKFVTSIAHNNTNMTQIAAVYYLLPLSWVKVAKNLLEMAFISLSANVTMQMFSETLRKTLNTPSGKEMSLQFDRSAEKKNTIMRLSSINSAAGEC